MCGLAGMMGPEASAAMVRRMMGSLQHRGPDDSGLWSQTGTGAQARAVLGHQRLSIIDLDTGRQPIANEDGRIHVVYNGETYNFRELRAELEAKGHRFATRSDTEVIVHLYEEEGPRAVERLNGIFAFALWDEHRQRGILARDRFGVKPLHYHWNGTTLRFGSEIKALLVDPAVPRALNPQALHDFLNIRFVPGDDTLFAGIRRLPPGHYLVYERGAVQLVRYWRLSAEEDRETSPATWAEGIRERLAHAVRRQLVSDVPVGAYLSGGLDSSSLVAAARQSDQSLQTFTLGFNEPTDELADASRVAEHFHTDHHAITLDAAPLAHLPAVIWHVEEPKVNVLQGFLLARFARQWVKVALGGLGGDELFAGYDIYRYLAPLAGVHRWVPRAFADHTFEPISRLAFTLQEGSGALRWHEHRLGVQWLAAVGRRARTYAMLRNAWDYNDGMQARLYGPALRAERLRSVEAYFEPYFTNNGTGIVTQALRAEFENKMVNDFLLNEDRVSMAHGLEVRVPFLDRDLVDYAWRIPAALKLAGSGPKHLFKRAVAPWLPAAVLSKRKWGFTFSSYHQFTKDLRPVAERILTRRRVEEIGWFNYEWIRRVLDHPAHPRLRWHYFVLWMMVGFEVWRQTFLAPAAVADPQPLEAYYG